MANRSSRCQINGMVVEGQPDRTGNPIFCQLPEDDARRCSGAQQRPSRSPRLETAADETRDALSCETRLLVAESTRAIIYCDCSSIFSRLICTHQPADRFRTARRCQQLSRGEGCRAGTRGPFALAFQNGYARDPARLNSKALATDFDPNERSGQGPGFTDRRRRIVGS